jgi:hypothetical protein
VPPPVITPAPLAPPGVVNAILASPPPVAPLAGLQLAVVEGGIRMPLPEAAPQPVELAEAEEAAPEAEAPAPVVPKPPVPVYPRRQSRH